MFAVVLNGTPLVLRWDTGAIPSVIKANIAKNMYITTCPKHWSYHTGPNCQRLTTHTLTTMKGEKLPKTWFIVTDIPTAAPFDGLVGSNFYQDNLVYFDFDRKLIDVKNVKI